MSQNGSVSSRVLVFLCLSRIRVCENDGEFMTKESLKCWLSASFLNRKRFAQVQIIIALSGGLIIISSIWFRVAPVKTSDDSYQTQIKALDTVESSLKSLSEFIKEEKNRIGESETGSPAAKR